MKCKWLLAAGLFPLCLRVFGAEYTLDVRNGAAARENAVVSHAVTREWAASAATHTLAEVTAEGQTSPVPCGVSPGCPGRATQRRPAICA